MYRIDLLNKISKKGLNLFTEKYEYRTDIPDPDGILVRSKEMKDMTLPSSLKAIARAGAGVNNIPIDKCSEKGIVVFNTPGANANGVKELVILGMLLASRKVVEGIVWTKGLIGEGDKVPDLIEKGKSKYGGTEILGKKLGVVGLGAIGTMVANTAEGLGMEVWGYDPFLSIEAAWRLSRNTKKAPSLDKLLSECDFISLHVPQNKDTKGFINTDKFSIMPGSFLFEMVSLDLSDLSRAHSGKLTEFLMFPFSRKSISCMAAMMAQFSSDSSVEAPRCGMAMTLSVLMTSSSGKSVT